MENNIEQLEQMAAKINSALAAKGYKAAEAHASVWIKEVKPRQKLQRIYLNGKKASGYVHCVGGKWEAEGIRYLMLSRIVEEAIA